MRGRELIMANRMSFLARNSSSSSILDGPRLLYHKVCLTGVSNVGKTSLFLRMKTGVFPDPQTVSTNGVDTQLLVRNVTEGKVGMSLNDTLGVEKCGTLTANYFKGAECILFMFCVEDQYSLESLDDAIKETSKHVTSSNCLFYLVANKVDLMSEITPDRVTEKQIELGCKKVFYISAKTGEGIDELFDEIATDLNMKAVNTLPAVSRIQLHVTQTQGEHGDKKCAC